MSDREKAVAEAERYVRLLARCLRSPVPLGNIPATKEGTQKELKQKLATVDYWRFVQSGQYHYFVHRVLFLRSIIEYGNFCGQQCVENYLKAFLQMHGVRPPTHHRLRSLLGRCRATTGPVPDFIGSDEAEAIACRFEPFNELARYPVQRVYPDGGYATVLPDDVKILDYFVYRMTPLVPVPANTWDLFRVGGPGEGHYRLHQCQAQFPEFYALVKQDNLNFL